MTSAKSARPRTRVVLAEDQTMVRGALATLLSLEADIAVVAEAANGREALKLVREHSPDILITDIEMPEMTGLELAANLQQQQLATRVIILTTFARPGYLRRGGGAGARGFIG
jgi:two-component system response regulator DesR